MSETPPLPAAAEEPTVSQARRLALAFQSVFGQPIRRSADQRLVIAHLRLMCGRDSAIFQQNKIGDYDPLRAAHTDGAQTQFLIIKRQLEKARKFAEKEKVNVKVKRSDRR